MAGAFIDAGAGAVVSSLWDADDDQTALLMAAFHRHLAAGVTPAQALRSAQLDALTAHATPDRLRTWSLFRLDHP